MKRIFVLITIIAAMSLNAAPTLDELCNNVHSYHDTINDYTCYLHAYTVKGNKSQNIKWDYKFMKPKYIRMESIEGDRKGSKAFYDYETQKVTGRRGGLLGAVKLTLPLTNSLVQNIRGITIAESDWFFVIDRLRNALDEDASEYEISDYTYRGNEAVELHIINIPFDEYNFDEVRYYFNSNGAIMGYKHYEEGGIAEDIYFSEVIINPGLEIEELYVK